MSTQGGSTKKHIAPALGSIEEIACSSSRQQCFGLVVAATLWEGRTAAIQDVESPSVLDIPDGQ